MTHLIYIENDDLYPVQMDPYTRPKIVPYFIILLFYHNLYGYSVNPQ